AYDRFVYAPGIIIKERHYNDRNEVFNDTLFLNKQGLVIAESGKDIAYEYNLDGYQSELRAGEILSYTISNGNTLTRKAWEYIDGNLKLILTTNYRFIPNSINTIGNENMGISFYGKQDKNLRSGANFTLDQNMTTP
ncbi:MAG TPA: hypothetical protein DCL77_01265, partial [Prolixibacteraceae bacterium]|nr:hypothetical protein [Prolixibacteraceae bacterium]